MSGQIVPIFQILQAYPFLIFRYKFNCVTLHLSVTCQVNIQTHGLERGKQTFGSSLDFLETDYFCNGYDCLCYTCAGGQHGSCDHQ